MKKLLVFFVLLFFSVFLGLFVEHDPGYVVFSYDNWILETTLWFAGLIVFLFASFCFLFLRLINIFFETSRRYENWQKNHAKYRANQKTVEGFLALAEGHWKKAENCLTASAGAKKNNLLNYLGAAIAAQEQDQTRKRDEFLRLAHQNSPYADTAISITQAKLQLEHNQLEQSLATLERLHQLLPKHSHVLKLLKQVYIRLNDWKSLEKILPKLKKYQVIDVTEHCSLERQIHLQTLLSKEQKPLDFSDWQALFAAIPKKFQLDSAFLQCYIPKIYSAKPDIAEALLKKSLKKEWNDDLIKLYGLCKCQDPKIQLSFCEQLLKERPENKTLLLSAARVCLVLQLWGKAEHYLETGLSSSNDPELYFELGQLHDRLGDFKKSQELFQTGLHLSLGIEG